eukprot:g30530.t1
MDPISLTADTEKFIRRMRLQEFFQDVSSKPNETTYEPDQSTERSMRERAKKDLNWTPLEVRCPGLDRYAQAIGECVNARFISHTHKVVQNVTQAQRMLSRPIVIKPADKGGVIIVRNRTDYCKEAFEQDFFAAQNLFLWTQGEESLKQLRSNINKFHPTIRLTTDYSLESVSFLDTCFSIKDRYLSTSLYRKPMNNLMMLHFSSFHPKHIKTAIPYRQALRIHRIYSDEEERDRHTKMLKDVLIRTRYDAQLIDRTSREQRNYAMFFVAFNIINDNEHFTKIFPTPPFLALKQPSNLKQTIVRSKLPSLQDNIDHNTIQPCHDNLCKTCQFFNMDTTIT